MKTLSLRQPWPGLITSGEKTIETRSWRTDYRGELLICSSQKFDKNAPSYLFVNATCHIRGETLCVVDLVDCVPMTDEHVLQASCQVYDGAWAWILENVREVKRLPIKGQLGLFKSPYTKEQLWH